MGARLGSQWVWLATTGLVACSSLIGIEDLNEGSAEGMGGSAGDAAGNGGQGAEAGSKSTAGNAGTAGSPSNGGSSGMAPGGAGGEPGEAGQGGAPIDDPTVRGRIVDLVGQPVPNAAITIGNTTVMSNAMGAFQVDDVPATYDVSAVFTVTGARQAFLGWVYQGLTRRDPTLQVYRGVSDQDTTLQVSIANGMFGASLFTMLAFGGPNGNDLSSATAAVTNANMNWYGPTRTAGALHALRWQAAMGGLPSAYQAYATSDVSLTAGMMGMTSVALPGSMIPSSRITGQTPDEATNRVFVRFADGAAIPVVDGVNGGNFSYLVPTLPDSTITVAASSGETPGQFALAHRDVAPGATGVDLTLPAPPLLVTPPSAPPNDPNLPVVGATTEFRFTSDARVFLVHVENNQVFEGLYILTNQNTLRLPSVPGFTLRAGQIHYWQVEIHGAWTSVDQATGTGGFQDSFGDAWEAPTGPRRGDGTFAMSFRNYFRTAP